MWIHKTAILARIFDCTPEVFDDRESTLVSFGAIVHIRLMKQALKN